MLDGRPSEENSVGNPATQTISRPGHGHGWHGTIDKALEWYSGRGRCGPGEQCYGKYHADTHGRVNQNGQRRAGNGESPKTKLQDMRKDGTGGLGSRTGTMYGVRTGEAAITQCSCHA